MYLYGCLICHALIELISKNSVVSNLSSTLKFDVVIFITRHQIKYQLKIPVQAGSTLTCKYYKPVNRLSSEI